MKIDRSNYENFLLDYLEGNLPEESRHLVEKFLAANPDIEEEFRNAKGFDFIHSETHSLNKSPLFRSLNDIEEITDHNFEEFCIAYYEGDLDDAARQKLERIIRFDPNKKTLFELHGKIHIQPDLNIKYPRKRELKKPVVIRLRRYVSFASAGAAALFIGFIIYFLSREPQVLPQTELSQETALHKDSPVASSLPEVKTISEPIEINKKVSKSKPVHPLTQLAVIDTTRESTPGTVILAAIDPIETKLQADHETASPVVQPPIDKFSPPPQQLVRVTENKSTGSAIQKYRVINRETLFWSAVQAGVKGFNTLTENELALDTEQNRKGQITGLKINAENFTFQRKFKKNIQN